MKKYILAVLVDNKPGVLTHVSGLISRRAFNIESISAGYTEDEDVTRINIEVSVEDDRELEQVVNQLSKLIADRSRRTPQAGFLGQCFTANRFRSHDIFIHDCRQDFLFSFTDFHRTLDSHSRASFAGT